MTVTFNISDLMDGLGDEALELYDPGVVRPERILVLTGERGRRRARRPRRIGRILLIAAALTALMTITAYAVYALVIDRYVVEQGVSPELGVPELTAEQAAEMPTPRPKTNKRISLVGYQGTPEYEACAEWELWLGAHRFDWKAAGVDDLWHETPDNYAFFYGAYTQEQADGLDAIMEKYGLTPHTNRGTFRSAEELYEALGTEPFYGGIFCTGSLTGYLYDDGSFKTEGDAMFADGRRVSVHGFTSAKGSFSDIRTYLDLEDCREWPYETGGLTVDLILAANGTELMAEADGAYIELALGGNSASLTQEDLEALADSVDFAVLAKRFDGAAHPGTAEKVAAMEERDWEQERASNASVQATPNPTADTRTEQQILDGLGDFGMDALPEGFAPDPASAAAGHSEAHESYWDFWSDGFPYDFGTRHYENTRGQGYLDLTWYRFYADDSLTVSVTDSVFDRARNQYTSSVCPLIDVGGNEGFAVTDDFSRRAMWLDRERDVLFELTSYDTPFDAAYMAALTGTVKPTAP